jgi:hypothetical protein
MKFKQITYKDKAYKNIDTIVEILKEEEFYWLIDSEISNAVIEIRKNTLIWHDGVYLNGNWHYGVFKGGEFYGNWLNGIFEDGLFSGKWNSGLRI